MSTIDHVMRMFPLLEDAEKKAKSISDEEKKMFYRVALYQPDFGEVEKLFLQIAAPHLSDGERRQLLEFHMERLPKPPSPEAEQSEAYVLEMGLRLYEMEKMNRMLREVLRENGLQVEQDALDKKEHEPSGEPQKGTDEKRRI